MVGATKIWEGGNVCNLAITGWKARSQLLVGYNCTFLLAITAEALIRRNQPLLKGVGQFGAKY